MYKEEILKINKEKGLTLIKSTSLLDDTDILYYVFDRDSPEHKEQRAVFKTKDIALAEMYFETKEKFK
jgi:hypothetical protein